MTNLETTNYNYIHNRPWGTFQVLHDSLECKIKKIIIFPSQRLSYQYHEKREEFWTILEGNPLLTLNEKIYHLKEGDQIHIPLLAKHRISNNSESNVMFIEIQRGSYFGEDDIVRLEDDYSRA